MWIHTHPGNCAGPSHVDEQTLARVFGNSDWALMFLLARGDQSYARLRINVGPGGQVEIPFSVDYRCPFGASERTAWEQEYLANVRPQPTVRSRKSAPIDPELAPPFDDTDDHTGADWYESWFEYAGDDPFPRDADDANDSDQPVLLTKRAGSC